MLSADFGAAYASVESYSGRRCCMDAICPRYRHNSPSSSSCSGSSNTCCGVDPGGVRLGEVGGEPVVRISGGPSGRRPLMAAGLILIALCDVGSVMTCKSFYVAQERERKQRSRPPSGRTYARGGIITLPGLQTPLRGRQTVWSPRCRAQRWRQHSRRSGGGPAHPGPGDPGAPRSDAPASGYESSGEVKGSDELSPLWDDQQRRAAVLR